MKSMFEMTIPEWLTHCLETVAEITPELSEENLYAISRPLQNLRGAAIPGLDLMFQDDIEASNKWYGRGPGILIDGPGNYQRCFHAAAEAGMNTNDADRFAKLEILKTVIHESAHLLRDQNYPGEPVSPDIAACRAAIDGFDEKFSQHPNSGQNAEIPWNFHDAPYIRIAAHLVARCRARGLTAFPQLGGTLSDARCRARGLTSISLGDLAAGENYSLSPGNLYYFYLQPELKYTAGKSIYAACFQHTPPRDFIELWREDIKKWWVSIPGQPSEEQEAAAIGALRLYEDVPQYIFS